MTTKTLNMIPMKTNEQRRNEADRRIPLNIYDIFYEFLGNMKGTIQKVQNLSQPLIIETHEFTPSCLDGKSSSYISYFDSLVSTR